MEINIDIIKNKLVESRLKVTPQRMAILEAIYSLDNHPIADDIIDYIKIKHPNIATGTVYKVLGVLIENKIINKVNTERGVSRYDGIMDSHHHLYCSKSDLIKDYFDEELDKILKNYFEKKKIPDFNIESIAIQLKGRFNE